MIPCNAFDNWRTICRCALPSNTPTIRSNAWVTFGECIVASTRWPVSAAVSAPFIESAVRISPMQRMSGSWRIESWIAISKLGVSTPTVFAAFSAALLVAAVLGPSAGRSIDRWGGRPVLAAGVREILDQLADERLTAFEQFRALALATPRAALVAGLRHDLGLDPEGDPLP